MSTHISPDSPIFIYGPPGSGKTSLGRRLAELLNLPFSDLDAVIEARSGKTIPQIFAESGEPGFRRQESTALDEVLSQPAGIVALGGGALLDCHNRQRVEAAGVVICLDAPFETLVARLSADQALRPLIHNDLQLKSERLRSLLVERADHYHSFSYLLDSSGDEESIARQAMTLLGRFRVEGMGAAYDVRVQPGGLDHIGEALRQRGLRGPVALVTDEHVAPLYADEVLASLGRLGYTAGQAVIPAGESHKTIDTVSRLWESFLALHLERGSTVVALGGGVVGDLAGFAAATFLRGVAWVAVPTSLLSMADASLGGKTGADLPQGKNLVGAFHPPRLVLADPQVLKTLPESELRSGLAEVVKAGVIADPELFRLCGQGWEAVLSNLDEIVRRSMAVKIQVIQADPFEQGVRASLNLGHTLGHALEFATGFRLRHGEAVAIGMVAAARLAEDMDQAKPGLAAEISGVLAGLGLPVDLPGNLDRESITKGMQVDKKRQGGQVRFVLPSSVGEVHTGVEVEEEKIWALF